MKPEQLYQELKDLAEKLEINVSEQNLRIAGIKVKSGLCKVRGKNMFIMDKHKSLHKRVKILATHLAQIPHENVFIVPAVRVLLEKYSPSSENWNVSSFSGLQKQKKPKRGGQVAFRRRFDARFWWFY